MSYFMDLQIGLYNAWIGSLFAWLSGVLFVMLSPKTGKRLANMSWYTPSDKRAAYSSMFMMYGVMIFSIWVPFKFGTAWFYTGAAIYVIGLILNIIALYNYASTPEDEAIVKGMYSISRNPLYLFHAIMIFGVCVAAASLPMFILWIIYNIPTHMIILGEERYCLETYGDSFKSYMERVPRYFRIF